MSYLCTYGDGAEGSGGDVFLLGPSSWLGLVATWFKLAGWTWTLLSMSIPCHFLASWFTTTHCRFPFSCNDRWRDGWVIISSTLDGMSIPRIDTYRSPANQASLRSSVWMVIEVMLDDIYFELGGVTWSTLIERTQCSCDLTQITSVTLRVVGHKVLH